MRDYGTDKPDLRIPLKLAEITDAVKDVEFKVSRRRRTGRAGVCARCVSWRRRAHARRARRLWRVRKTLGAKGLAWIKVNQRAKGAEGLQSPIVKNLHARARHHPRRTASKTATSSSSAPATH